MAQLFLSYAREDSDDAQQLYEQLHDAGHAIWMDTHDIPATSEWQQEIDTAIARSDMVVCLLSPDALHSVACQHEVTYAQELHKRLAPIVCRQVIPQEALPGLAALQWIWWRTTDEREQAFQSLLTAIGTDLAAAQEATRLLVHAQDWEAKHERASLALRGDDLHEAEQWLASAAEHAPGPTAAHVRFITASRRLAARRQQWALTAVSCVLIVTLLLSAISTAFFLQAQSANQQEQQTLRLTMSRALATQAIQQEQIDPALSMLLGAQAEHFAPTAASRDGLARLATRYHRLRAILPLQLPSDPAIPFPLMALNTGGNWLTMLIPADASIANLELWDTNSRHLVVTIPVYAPAGASSSWSPTGLAISSDGRWLAMSDVTGAITLWNIVTPRNIRQTTLSAPPGTPVLPDNGGVIPTSPNNLAFSPDGLVLESMGCTDLVSCNTQTLTLWARQSLSSPWELLASAAFAAQSVQIEGLAFTPGKRDTNLTLALCPMSGQTSTCAGAGTVVQWDGATQQILQSLPAIPLSSVTGLAYDSLGTTLIISGTCTCNDPQQPGRVYFENLSGDAEDSSVVLPFADSTPTIVGLEPDGQTALIATNLAYDCTETSSITLTSSLPVIDIADVTGSDICQPATLETFVPMLFTLYNFHTHQILDQLAPPSSQQDLPYAPFYLYAAQTHTLVTVGETGVALWNTAPADWFLWAGLLPSYGRSLTQVVTSTNGKFLATLTCDPIAAIPISPTNPVPNFTQPDYSCKHSQVRVWDIASRRPVGEPLDGVADGVVNGSGEGPATSQGSPIAISSNGQRLVSLRCRTPNQGLCDILLWDVPTGRLLTTLATAVLVNSGPVISADGTVVAWSLTNLDAQGNLQGTDVVLADIKHPNAIAIQRISLTSDPTSPTALAWSPSSSTLAIMFNCDSSCSPSLQLWTVEPQHTAKLFLNLLSDSLSSATSFSSGVSAQLQYSPDGRMLIALLESGSAPALVTWMLPTPTPSPTSETSAISEAAQQVGTVQGANIPIGNLNLLDGQSSAAGAMIDDSTAVITQCVLQSPSGCQDEVQMLDLTSGAIIGVPLYTSQSWGSTTNYPNGNAEVGIATALAGHTTIAWTTIDPGSLTLWSTDTPQWIVHGCQAAGRQLTRAEWATYIIGFSYAPAC